jgi:transcriptional regulator with XRE-family HTH domain
MSNYQLHTPRQITELMGQKIQKLRVHKNWTQKTLSERSGVSLGTLRRFEQSGDISLNSLMMLVGALGMLDEFLKILEPPLARSIRELERMEKVKTRKRGSS